MQASSGAENRNPHDTPLSELDCEVFHEFYFEFLGKTEAERLDFLKGLTLMRQAQRRAFVHSVIAARSLAEALFTTEAERELLLTYPSTLETIWNAMLDYKRAYRGLGSAPLTPIRDMVVGYLAEIKNVRNELREVLRPSRPIQPKEKLNLAIAFASTGELKQSQRQTYQVLLIGLTANPYLCIAPENAQHSTMALGKLRGYINQLLAAKADSLYVEFFTVGGALLKKNEGRVQIGGSHPIFDVIFNNPYGTYTRKIQAAYNQAKFTLIYEILHDEFPAEVFAWDTEEE